MTLLDRLGGSSSPTETPAIPELARWATTLAPSDVPEPVWRAAGAQRASTVGAAVWTLSHPLSDSISAALASDPSGPCTFLAGDEKGPSAAAAGNAALSMALDFDDTVLGGHTGHSTVFVPLAVAEATDADPARVALAHVAANEVAARVAAAAAVGPFRGQQTAYIHAVGAAVARAVVEGDDSETLADALGIALGQPPWPLESAFLGSDAKHWSASEPIRAGLAALEAARAGQCGRDNLLESDAGFLDSFSTIPLPAFLGGLGERWHTRAVTVKAVPGCAYVTAPVEAALAIRQELEADPAAIQRVTVHGSLFATEVDDRASPYLEGPDSPVSALTFTVPYGVAAALVDGEFTPRQLAPDRVEDDRIWSLTDRVDLVHDPELTMAALRSEVPVGAMLRRVGLPVLPYAAKTVGIGTVARHLPTLLRLARKRPLPTDLAEADKRMGARVTVETADGRTVARSVPHPNGFAGQPLDSIEGVAREKCTAAFEAVGLGAETAADRVESLVTLESADTLPSLGVAP